MPSYTGAPTDVGNTTKISEYQDLFVLALLTLLLVPLSNRNGSTFPTGIDFLHTYSLFLIEPMVCPSLHFSITLSVLPNIVIWIHSTPHLCTRFCGLVILWHHVKLLNYPFWPIPYHEFILK